MPHQGDLRTLTFYCALMLMGLVTTATEAAFAATCTEWAEGRSFTVGEVVTHQGLTYTNIQPHTAWVGTNWTPPRTPALWGAGGTCEGPVGTFHEITALPGEHTLTVTWLSRNIDGSSVGRWQVWEAATKIHDSTNIQTFTVEPEPGCTNDCFAGVVSLGHAVLFNITAGEHTYVFKLCDAAGNVCNVSAPHTVTVRAVAMIPLTTVSVPGPCARGSAYPTWSEGQDYAVNQAVFSRTGQFMVQLDTMAFTGVFIANDDHRSSTANEPIVSRGRPQHNPFWHLAAITKPDCAPPVPPLGPVNFFARGGAGSVSFLWSFDSVFGDAFRWQIWEGTLKVLDSTTIDTEESFTFCQNLPVSCEGPTFRAGRGSLSNVAPGAHSYVLRLCDAAETQCSLSEPRTVTVAPP